MGRFVAVLRLRRRFFLGLGAAGVALAVFVLWWFQPQKLFIDDRVDEPVPMARTTAAPAPGDPTAAPGAQRQPAGPAVLATGRFRSGEHHTEGTATILRLADGRRFLRLPDFETSNGPVLVVWLSEADAAASDDENDDATRLDLGGLKGNIGNQNYAVPEGVDLDRYRSVVIWCARFHVTVGAAPLSA
jgi:hypothetical protein